MSLGSHPSRSYRDRLSLVWNKTDIHAVNWGNQGKSEYFLRAENDPGLRCRMQTLSYKHR